jgi:PIN domain nuclease of toxin-antitoxin system
MEMKLSSIISPTFEALIPEQLEENEFDILHIRLDDLSRLVRLPLHHRDPFDRLIIAQAKIRNIPIITSDSIFNSYDARIIW